MLPYGGHPALRQRARDKRWDEAGVTESGVARCWNGVDANRRTPDCASSSLRPCEAEGFPVGKGPFKRWRDLRCGSVCPPADLGLRADGAAAWREMTERWDAVAATKGRGRCRMERASCVAGCGRSHERRGSVSRWQGGGSSSNGDGFAWGARASGADRVCFFGRPAVVVARSALSKALSRVARRRHGGDGLAQGCIRYARSAFGERRCGFRRAFERGGGEGPALVWKIVVRPFRFRAFLRVRGARFRHCERWRFHAIPLCFRGPPGVAGCGDSRMRTAWGMAQCAPMACSERSNSRTYIVRGMARRHGVA